MSPAEQTCETPCDLKDLRTLGGRVVDVGAKALKVPRVDDHGVIRAFEQGWDRRDCWHAW
jgi:hypothetical protein